MSQPINIMCANAIRALAFDAVQQANSGHPGAPMGQADLAFVLWDEFLHFDPEDVASKWDVTFSYFPAVTPQCSNMH